MWSIRTVILVYLLQIHTTGCNSKPQASVGSDCRTHPAGIQGKCIPIQGCPRLNSLLIRSQRGEADAIQILRKSVCSTNSTNPVRICCETTATEVIRPSQGSTGPVTGCEECSTTEQPCNVLGGTCQKKDAVCDGNMIKADIYCKPSEKCICCFPKNIVCDPKPKFKKDHVCHDCSETMTPLMFTKWVRGEPTYTVPANTVFVSNDITYVYGVRIYEDNNKPRYELTCDMSDYVPTYYCCRTVLGYWNGCDGPANCKVNVRDKNGHLLDDTFECQL